MVSYEKDAYTEAGVDIAKATETMKLIKNSIRSTYNERVLKNFGLFAGMLDISSVKKYQHPILVLSIDGVGTKLTVAEAMDKYTVGQCLVNHCVNDILAQGALPLAFLDYVASAELKPEIVKKIISEMAIACREIGIPIIGGETAEMPGVYKEGQHDLVGCIAGIVEKEKIIDGSKITEEDVLIALPSNGMHTNGFSLARKALFTTAGYNVNTHLDELGCTVGEELLKIHKNYLEPITALLKNNIEIHGIAHITGGGFFDNIGRLLQDGLCAEISHKWEIPRIFRIIQQIEKVPNAEMRKDFNLGIGMVLIIPSGRAKEAKSILSQHNEPNNTVIGKIIAATKKEKVVFTY